MQILMINADGIRDGMCNQMCNQMCNVEQNVEGDEDYPAHVGYGRQKVEQEEKAGGIRHEDREREYEYDGSYASTGGTDPMQENAGAAAYASTGGSDHNARDAGGGAEGLDGGEDDVRWEMDDEHAGACSASIMQGHLDAVGWSLDIDSEEGQQLPAPREMVRY
ncbi:hypothetical protein GUITHDRAFT_112553 [Guillardia theta CCMP2712]|uniref:Uncharacterized protein n=1 Tax=Guillardia theta (strain CCMP2712) TaxID=905079 RepID=L1IYK3_GUITC|nr:hypothetical protein GUITHDRAFT_112553 [Guillardia theta CCMP2712]EKX41343.1 hypothetical protein GUITHDRAFT_112553 [Guillardia theta CCMP2712]|eukprot:XP_005828323.1 hypothetical protein GUITHDRAFT_112553 [Guillardia theta CCMP2712]